ncbi:putative potassium transport system protein kup 2 [Hyphomicrobiales bacterium]|nr:putative potassium transport system protein kup 2 [Hyphomicrobiales bacterium]CAH1670833.1 putative potassium transport system protein kup 2 [Hyphomicrobiales bacterium]
MSHAVAGQNANAGAAPTHQSGASPQSLLALALGTAGVVYGDIGTSPLYAFREALAHAGPGGLENKVLGVLSLILWTLALVVTVKYVIVLLRADNNGEGGTLSLVALLQHAKGSRSGFVILLGIIGAALFYGDAVITPAISVLSAVEGLKLITPVFEPYILPLTVALLVAIFAIQYRGTARVAALFGPIMVVWFLILALGGLGGLVSNPDVLAAFDPRFGIAFLMEHGSIGFVTLGAVFLAVTGAEALYADLGHFGRAPIRLTWLGLVFPALALNYLGQAAVVLDNPSAASDPFFLLFPEWALIPVVVLATGATVIASQAVITGAFSLSRQAIQLGLLPRLTISHTSESHAGQIYMPRINMMLLVGVLCAVFAFRSSAGLASAYGIAVTGTMVVTTLLAFLVVWRVWRWSLLATAALFSPLFVLDVTFLSANLSKMGHGGLFPLVVSAGLITVMLTWRRGVRVVSEKTRHAEVSMEELARLLELSHPHRVKGTAVFLTGEPDTAPRALLHNLKHNKVLHEKNVILTVTTSDRPRVPDAERVEITPVNDDFTQVTMTFGYAETPNVPQGLAIARTCGWRSDIMSTSFFLSRRSLRRGPQSKLPRWQAALFIHLARNAADATDFFQIPTGRTLEVGVQVPL